MCPARRKWRKSHGHTQRCCCNIHQYRSENMQYFISFSLPRFTYNPGIPNRCACRRRRGLCVLSVCCVTCVLLRARLPFSSRPNLDTRHSDTIVSTYARIRHTHIACIARARALQCDDVFVDRSINLQMAGLHVECLERIIIIQACGVCEHAQMLCVLACWAFV